MDRGGREVLVRNAIPQDAAVIARIYNHYVSQTVITFEEAVVSQADIEGRVAELQKDAWPWLVAETPAPGGGRTLGGYAYAAPWRPRCAYRLSCEVTVYVDPDRARCGIGSALYDRLLPLLREAGMHTALGGVALPNEASVALHERFGFRKTAHLEQVGFKLGRWVDVGYWQLMLDGGADTEEG